MDGLVKNTYAIPCIVHMCACGKYVQNARNRSFSELSLGKSYQIQNLSNQIQKFYAQRRATSAQVAQACRPEIAGVSKTNILIRISHYKVNTTHRMLHDSHAVHHMKLIHLTI